MSAVKGKGSKAEIQLAKSMWRLGLRYRKHPNNIIGRPDFVFMGTKVAIFCDGDFWHGKGWRSRGFSTWEEQFIGINNSEYWQDKIRKNMARDKYVNKALRNSGWSVIRLLESQILRDPDYHARSVKKAIESRKRAASI